MKNSNIMFIIIVIFFICCYCLFKKCFNYDIPNSIALTTSLSSIILTLYNNYKSDLRVEMQLEHSEKQFNKQLEANKENLREQLVFNKRQKLMLDLGTLLQEYHYLLFEEDIDDDGYEHKFDGFMHNFFDVYSPIIDLKQSFEFIYLSKRLRDSIVNLTEYINNHLDIEYWEEMDVPFKTNDEFIIVLDKLAEIYNILQKEIITYDF